VKTVYINPNAPVEFKPTKSAKKGREFIPSDPGGKFAKFGYCNYLKKWVRRDSMMGVNARFYDADSNQTTVRLRLSPEGWEALLKIASENEWNGSLKSREELIEEGCVFEDSHDDSDD
jgi:hypothetical protein